MKKKDTVWCQIYYMNVDIRLVTIIRRVALYFIAGWRAHPSMVIAGVQDVVITLLRTLYYTADNRSTPYLRATRLTSMFAI